MAADPDELTLEAAEVRPYDPRPRYPWVRGYFAWEYAPERADLPVAHFIHVGKTAGTSIKTALYESMPSPRYDVRLLKHSVRMAYLPPDEKFFFAVRDPVRRFVSGFLSRRRQGLPRHDSPWGPEEYLAFSRFWTPEELGLALGASGPDRAFAEEAMNSIEHVNQSYWYWFEDEDHFLAEEHRILWIGRQRYMSRDLPLLAWILDIPELVLPEDDYDAHRTPAGLPTSVSRKAQANLREWYARDYDFLALCGKIRTKLITRTRRAMLRPR